MPGSNAIARPGSYHCQQALPHIRNRCLRQAKYTSGCAMPLSETTDERPKIAEAIRAPLPTAVARFEIRYSRFLDPKGNAVRPLPDFARDRAQLVALYRAMVLARRFDAKAVSLQRTGRLGTFASALGQEGVPVGIASAMRAEDVL